jgi:hypothetical protein
MPNPNWCLAALLVLLAMSVVSCSGQVSLQCVSPFGPASSAISEAGKKDVWLRQSPHGALRIGKHRLRVKWAAGAHVFEDKPPYGEPLDGIKWTYCGFDAKVRLHLIGKQDVDIFTGALLDDRSGQLLPGGQLVLFSPDEQQDLAYEQPDGQDGETIKLYTRIGKLIWSGFNGVLSADGKTVLADFQNVTFDAHNRLVAEMESSATQKRFLVLTKQSNGRWNWLPTGGR